MNRLTCKIKRLRIYLKWLNDDVWNDIYYFTSWVVQDLNDFVNTNIVHYLSRDRMLLLCSTLYCVLLDKYINSTIRNRFSVFEEHITYYNGKHILLPYVSERWSNEDEFLAWNFYISHKSFLSKPYTLYSSALSHSVLLDEKC